MGPAEELFEGKPTGLPAPRTRRTALYKPGTGPEPEVKHVAGYGRFTGFCAAQGVRAEELAADPERLFRFLRAIGTELEDDSSLKAAAAIFTGNTIARLRADSRWTTYEGGSPAVGNSRKQFEVDRLLEALRWADDEAVQRFNAVLAAWAQEEPGESQALHLLPVPGPAGQPRYVRPPLPAVTYYSGDGEPVPYGRHWGDDGPDPDSYGIDSHPERFSGLHNVAFALIDHLAAAFDVEVDEDPVHAAELMMNARDVLQAVKVTPRRSRTAPLTFVLTAYPGVIVHAGVLHDFPFPVCGCDACDETAETTAERMELLVLTVAAGGYNERYPVGRHRWSEYALAAYDGSGSESGQGEPVTVAPDRLHEAEIRLREAGGAWLPWPLKDVSPAKS
jgi:hypothetical protein